MFSVLTSSGQDTIDYADANAVKFQITHFKVGDLATSLPDLTPKPQNYDFSDYPNLRSPTWLTDNFIEKFSGDNTKITYVPYMTDTLILKCYVPQDVATFMFNSVMIHATVNSVEQIFSFHYFLHDNPKFSTVSNRNGTRYYFMLVLKIANRDTRFDYTNLTLETPEFASIASIFDLPYPAYEPHDQMILLNHEQSDYRGPSMVINSQDSLYGAMMVPFSPSDLDAPLLIASLRGPYQLADNVPVPLGYQLIVNGSNQPLLDRYGKRMMEKLPGYWSAASLIDGNDTLSATGTLPLSAQAAITEDDDTPSAQGTIV